jgi:uncharacterized low-complexity protein
MSQKILKPAALCSAVVLGSLALSSSAFAFGTLAQGYALGATAVAEDDKAAHGNCGADKAAHEGNCGANKGAQGKCGEGKCGGMNMDADKDGMVSAAEHAAVAQRRFAAADKNKDGMVDAAEMKASHEGKCGEGKCGAK